MGGIAQAVGSVMGAGGQGGTYTAAGLTTQNDLINNSQVNQNNLNQLYAQQQILAGNLGQQAQGQGPNLANAMLRQATNQNMGQAAGIAASQQGISPAMAAQLAVTQGAQTSQQAANQASINRMNQQLTAQQQQEQLYGQAGSQQLQNQQTMQQALANQNQATNSQSNINSGMAQANMAGQQKAVGSLINGVSAGLAFGGSIPDHLTGFTEHLSAMGGGVPGQAQVSGDSPENDTVPAMLSPKEVVLPRSVTMAPDAPEKARDFVANLQNQSGDEAEFKEALKRMSKKRK